MVEFRITSKTILPFGHLLKALVHRGFINMKVFLVSVVHRPLTPVRILRWACNIHVNCSVFIDVGTSYKCTRVALFLHLAQARPSSIYHKNGPHLRVSAQVASCQLAHAGSTRSTLPASTPYSAASCCPEDG